MARQYSQADRDRFAAERRDQLERLQSQIAGKVTDLVNGAEWQQWLSVAAKFHQYSFNNTMLIMLQRPEATLVAGYKTWQTSFGRQVNKGETGIRILAPVTKRIEKHTPDGAPVLDNDGNPVKVTALVGLKPVSVFDITQTSGPDLPTPATPKLLTGEAPVGLWDRLQAFVEAQGYSVERGDCRGANGYTDPHARLVRVRGDVDDAQAVKTLAHEAGHVLLHTGDKDLDAGPCRGSREVEAESVACLVTCAHGLDSAQYTFSYVAGWAESAQRAAPEGTTLADVIASTGTRVIGAADTILAATQPCTGVDDVLDATTATIDRTLATNKSFAIAKDISKPAVRRPERHQSPSSRTVSVPRR